MPPSAALSKQTSQVLDLARTASALVVFLYHTTLIWDNRAAPVLAAYAHLAVVVFFVLSGFLIAYSTDRSHVTLGDYISARLSRLYSVVVPAVVLTAVLTILGTHFFPATYRVFNRGYEPVRLILTLFFSQNLWFFSASPPTNSPFWSLSYEYWYYFLFGIFSFTRGLRRVLYLLIAALIIGPPILLLLPCWVIGALVYKRLLSSDSPTRVGTAAVCFAMVALAYLMLTRRQFPFPVGIAPLYFSNAFVTDICSAICVAVSIAYFVSSAGFAPIQGWAALFVQKMASLTFSVYLFHYPLLILTRALAQGNHHPLAREAIAGSSALLISLGLGAATESRRKIYVPLIRYLLPLRYFQHYQRAR